MSDTLKRLAMAEVLEMSQLVSRYEAELRETNERMARLQADRDNAKAVAAAILWHRQIEVAAFGELLADIKASGNADERTKRLIDNAQRAMQGS
jgi:hypothetical protein